MAFEIESREEFEDRLVRDYAAMQRAGFPRSDDPIDFDVNHASPFGRPRLAASPEAPGSPRILSAITQSSQSLVCLECGSEGCSLCLTISGMAWNAEADGSPVEGETPACFTSRLRERAGETLRASVEEKRSLWPDNDPQRDQPEWDGIN